MLGVRKHWMGDGGSGEGVRGLREAGRERIGDSAITAVRKWIGDGVGLGWETGDLGRT